MKNIFKLASSPALLLWRREPVQNQIVNFFYYMAPFSFGEGQGMRPIIKFHTLLLAFFFSCIGMQCKAADSNEIFIRYNHVGYESKGLKRLVIFSNSNCKGKIWEIKNLEGKVLLNGKVNGSICGKSVHTSHEYNHVIDFTSVSDTGVFVFAIEGDKAINVNIKTQPYAFIPSEILRYLRVARSGSHEALDHKISHLGDSSCEVYRKTTGDNSSWEISKDGKRLNAQGGWYDAGDYIKFTLTIAYTTYQLLHAYDVYPELFQQKKYSKSDLVDVLDEAKWGLDYLMKMMPDSTEFIIQTGGSADHEEGNRLPHEDLLNGKRECYSDFSITQMGYTAAALALGANIFKKEGKEALSKQYMEMAIKVFNKASQYNHSSWFQKGWEIFYNDESPQDNMELAATELYKLTSDVYYLKQAKIYAQEAMEGYWASWGNANLIAHSRLMSHYGYTATYIYNDMEIFEKIAEQPGNIWGVPHEYTWASLYSMLEVANGGMLYDYQKNFKLYEKLRYDVLDYTLGMNNWGIAMVASPNIPKSIRNVYSQVYVLQPDLYPTGAVAEGPGDMKTHEEVKKWFSLPVNDPNNAFNTNAVVFYDHSSNFQTMETTIGGLADALLFFTLISKMENRNNE